MAQEVFWLLLGEVQADPGLVDGGFAVGRVVHLQQKVRAFGNVHAGTFRHAGRLVARRVADNVVIEHALAAPAGLAAVPGPIGSADQHVVHDIAIAGNDRCCLDPDAVVQGVLQHRELVVDGARGRHLKGRHFQHQVRRAQRPLIARPGDGQQRIFAFAAGGARFDPVDEGLRFFDAQALVALPVADLRVGVPGRHAPGAHHFANHWREALNHGVAGHRPGPDAAGPVADRALFLQQGRDGVGVADGRVIGLARREVDQATHGIAFCLADFAAGQHGGQRILCVAFAGLFFLSLVVEPVIQGTAVHDLPGARLDDQHLAGPDQFQGFADQLRGVVQDRHVDAPFPGFCRDAGTLVLEVGVEHGKAHALGLELVAQRLEVGDGVAHDRAAVAVHHQRDGLVVAVVQLLSLAGVVEQYEIIDALRLGRQGLKREQQRREQRAGQAAGQASAASGLSGGLGRGVHGGCSGQNILLSMP